MYAVAVFSSKPCRVYAYTYIKVAVNIGLVLQSCVKLSRRESEVIGVCRYFSDILSFSSTAMGFGFYKILFHFEALLHNNIFCKHPLYCAIYCTILPVLLHPPVKI